MTVNEQIKTALAPLALPVKPDRYKGDEESYLVFNYTTMGMGFSDDAPGYERYLVQVHYFCPEGVSSIAIREKIKRMLFNAGFTWPDEVNAADSSMQKNDDNKQHYVFECEYVEGLYGGTEY